MGEVYRATAQTTAVVMEPVECPTLADLIAGSGLKAQGLGLDDGIKIPISSVVMAQVADGWSAL
jgi:hypothetical protein